MKRKPKIPGIKVPPKPDHPAWEKRSQKEWGKKWRAAVKEATRPLDPPSWIRPSSTRGGSSSEWKPRAFTKKERDAIIAHVRPKFEEVVHEAKRVEREAKTSLLFETFFMALDNSVARGILTKQLISSGFDKQDVEAIVEKYFAVKDYIRNRERGIYAILRDWTNYFFQEMSGTRIAEVTGRPVEPRYKSARFPIQVAAEITAKLLSEFYPEHKLKARTLKNYLRKIPEK